MCAEARKVSGRIMQRYRKYWIHCWQTLLSASRVRWRETISFWPDRQWLMSGRRNGVVTDESGEPWSGYRSGERWQPRQCDRPEGKFTLVANVGDVLQFGYIDMFHRKWSWRIWNCCVVLREDANLLDEVVVTAMAAWRRKTWQVPLPMCRLKRWRKRNRLPCRDLLRSAAPDWTWICPTMPKAVIC